ncbi:hypothetical protein CFC21_107945 [Triticum aestivum]|uniref:Ionotropic glutamate receptor C-terminal domain-containing protein n=3 Tax=Triticum aestivum TaxID=4565 RepID=A0A9R1MHB0_WHEAT|nr:hypothetical protein CFC21_107945 [Triticum aestivum]
MERSLAVVLLVMLTLWSVPAAAGDGSISPAPEACRLDGLPRGSPGDATTAEIGIMNNRILSGRETGALTRGYVKTLRIAVPQKPGFKAFVNATSHKVSGYCIDIFEAAAKKLPRVLHYKFVVVDGSYDELVCNVSLGIYDAVVGDITITAERAVDVDFTMPYTESGVSLLVLTENDSKPAIEWVFLKPLTTELWLALMGGFFFTGLVVWTIEWPRNPEYQGSSLRQCSTALYFSFSTLTFSHGQIIRSPLSKIVVVIWCFVVLVIVQSYTASLSSILTAKRLRPSVTDLEQLRSNGDYIGYQSGSFVQSVLKKRGFNVNRLNAYTNKTEYAEALRKGSKNGGVSAIVDEIPYITSFLSDPKYHNEFQMVNRIYKTPGLGFVFPKESQLVHDLSVAILELTFGAEGSQIEEKWLGKATPLPSYGMPNTDAAPLTLQSFSGLFIITSSEGDGGSEGHGGSGPLQNGTGNGSMADQPHHEARNEHPQGVNGIRESPGDVEPNDSVPEPAILIEMNTR